MSGGAGLEGKQGGDSFWAKKLKCEVERSEGGLKEVGESMGAKNKQSKFIYIEQFIHKGSSTSCTKIKAQENDNIIHEMIKKVRTEDKIQ